MLFIHKIINEDRQWLQAYDTIVEASCDHFQQIFTGEDKNINENLLECIPSMVSQNQTQKLINIPTMEELKKVFFSMSPTSAARLN